MLNKIKKSQSEGFTIIEVMIVLAIAGLILLIVLLAVPALQRNSRNTALKNDASQVLGYINDNVANNDGAKVTNVTSSSGTVTVTGGNTSTGKIQTGTDINSPVSTFSASRSTSISTGKLYVFLGEACGSTSTTTYTDPATGSSRAVAVVYAIETSSGTDVKCIGG